LTKAVGTRLTSNRQIVYKTFLLFF